MYLHTSKLKTSNPKWSTVKTELTKLDEAKIGYLNIENCDNDYIQCVGKSGLFCVEYRLNSELPFKHYVIGNHEIVNPIKVSWSVLQTMVGEVMIQKHEVFSLDKVEMIFNEFYKSQIIPPGLSMRNVTKLHKK